MINRIKPAINGIIGVTERGRSDPRAWPRNPGNEDAADAATDVLRFIADFNRFKRVKQDCFLDMLVPGTMAALVGVDDDKQVTITQVRWEEFFYDPRSRRPDFKDARYLGIAKWMYADDVHGAVSGQEATSIEPTPWTTAPAAASCRTQSYQDRPLNGSGTGGAVDRPQAAPPAGGGDVLSRERLAAGGLHRDGRAGERRQPLPRPQGQAGLPDRGAERLRQARQQPLRRGVGHDRSSSSGLFPPLVSTR